MKLILESIVNPQILWLLIRIVLTCFFYHLLLSRIIEHGMSTGVNRMPHNRLFRILSDVGSVKFLKVRRSVWASTRRNGAASPLQILLFLDQLLSPLPVFDIPSYCCTIAINYCPTTTTTRGLLITRLGQLPLPPPVIFTSRGHLCKNIDQNEKLYKWRVQVTL